MVGYRVPPKSRKEIESAASVLRKAFCKEAEYFFPLMKLLEIELPKSFPNFNLDILDDGSLEGNARALTYPDQKVMLIANSVYEGAVDGVGKDRMTIAHEIGHLLLHQAVSFAKQYENDPIKTYENSEWQADVFAGELLAPIRLIGGKGLLEIAEDFGVSPSAANAQLNALKKACAATKKLPLLKLQRR